MARNYGLIQLSEGLRFEMEMNERREQILSIVNNSNKSIKTSTLATKFNVTSETIRKDIIFLAEKQLLKKFHGGAMPNSEFVEQTLDVRQAESTHFKKSIAKVAVDHIQDCSVIFIDAGSTTAELAKLLVDQQHNALLSKAFVTNSFSIANILIDHARTLFFLGGEVSSVTQACDGVWAENELDTITIDLAFLGSSGFCSRQGPCTKLSRDASFKANIIRRSSKKILLVDHTKFTSNAIMQYAKWSDIDLIITDNCVSSEQTHYLSSLVEIITSDDNKTLGNTDN